VDAVDQEPGSAVDEVGPVGHTGAGPLARQRAHRPAVADPDRLPDEGGDPGADDAQRVIDYLAGMTDGYCIRVFEELTVPESFAA